MAGHQISDYWGSYGQDYAIGSTASTTTVYTIVNVYSAISNSPMTPSSSDEATSVLLAINGWLTGISSNCVIDSIEVYVVSNAKGTIFDKTGAVSGTTYYATYDYNPAGDSLFFYMKVGYHSNNGSQCGWNMYSSSNSGSFAALYEQVTLVQHVSLGLTGIYTGATLQIEVTEASGGTASFYSGYCQEEITDTTETSTLYNNTSPVANTQYTENVLSSNDIMDHDIEFYALITVGATWAGGTGGGSIVVGMNWNFQLTSPVIPT